MMSKPVAKIGVDMHQCPVSNGPTPHVGGPIISTNPNPTVFVNGQAIATTADKGVCNGPLADLPQGSSTVFANGQSLIRLGDMTAHGGKVLVNGISTVFSG